MEGVDCLAEGVHLGLSGGPAGAEADTAVGLVHPLPVFIAEVLAQDGQFCIGQDGVLLVGGGVEQQGIAVGHKDVTDLVGHVDGVAGDFGI